MVHAASRKPVCSVETVREFRHKVQNSRSLQIPFISLLEEYWGLRPMLAKSESVDLLDEIIGGSQGSPLWSNLRVISEIHLQKRRGFAWVFLLDDDGVAFMTSCSSASSKALKFMPEELDKYLKKVLSDPAAPKLQPVGKKK